MRKAAGILMIIGGLIGGSIWLTIVRELIIGLALSGGPYSPEEATQLAVRLGSLITLTGFSPMAVAAIGGVMALKKVHYKWALAGAICSILFPPFGIPALILLVRRKSEFEEEEEEEEKEKEQEQD
jgi:fructose-specific phosphotransferase system IIC component